ncbi:MAG TPA: helix-hairpin-helix domain-containing protein [Tepidisphaeraceae bacterium]|nr:helix-hairpin-helix domain-containing protein [Tepidisphaeraceae bacterium]
MPKPTEPIAWTEAQRRVLIVLTFAVAVVLLIRLMRESTTVTDPPPVLGARSVELANRIDPNTADVATLAALPGLGKIRARGFVLYRESVAQRSPGELAFRRPEDLMRVDGIGVAMMTQLSPFMVFPATQPSNTEPRNAD